MTRLLQPSSFEAFRCIGSECEDTCCDGWGIMIDRQTFARYRETSDSQLRGSLDAFVVIDDADRTDDHYAKIALAGTRCPFLSDGLCSIQVRLGEDYLSKTCTTYPRVTNRVDDFVQRSLDLSCPEAARLVLLDPNPLEFREEERAADLGRLANISELNTAVLKPGKPYRYFWEVRRLVVGLLQNRSYDLWKRLVILAHFCDKLTQTAEADVPAIVEGYAGAIERRLFDEILSQCEPQPAAQMEIAIELIVKRISSDFTNRRFLECYQEFMHGIAWTAESTMDEIALRYTEAYFQYYAPFIREHEYMLENYLVNYVYKTLFPFGPQKSSHQIGQRYFELTISTQYAFMAVHYAVIKAILIGMAGFHKTALAPHHVVKLIQTATRTFEHSVAYPDQAGEILASRNLNTAVSLSILVQN